MVRRQRAGELSEQQIVVRLSNKMLEMLDAHKRRLQKDRPGARVTRSDAVRDLIARSLR